MTRVTVSPIECAVLLQNFLRHSQPALAINTAVTAPVELVVVLQDHDVITKEPRGLCPRVAEQRLGFGEFAVELSSQERPTGRLALLGFATGPAKPQQPIGRRASVAQASISGIVGVKRGNRLPVTSQAACRLWPSPTAHRCRRTSETLPRWSDAASGATGIGWKEGLFDKRSEFAQVEARKDGAQQPSYNIAKRPLEFLVTIPRKHLRAGYGQGFRGAPLQSDIEAGRSSQGRPGGPRGTTRTTPKKTPRGPCEI